MTCCLNASMAWTEEQNLVIECEQKSSSCIATFDNKNYEVTVGKNGLSDSKKEGDGTTPIGEFELYNTIFYRGDRLNVTIIENRNYSLRTTVKKNLAWCDDSESENYNKLIDLTKNQICQSYELLHLGDDYMYDIVIPINYNMNPTVKGKGSAIFMHIQRSKDAPTDGCVAFTAEDLIEIVKKLTHDTKVIIRNATS